MQFKCPKCQKESEDHNWKAMHIKTYSTDYLVTCIDCKHEFWKRIWD